MLCNHAKCYVTMQNVVVFQKVGDSQERFKWCHRKAQISDEVMNNDGQEKKCEEEGLEAASPASRQA